MSKRYERCVATSNGIAAVIKGGTQLFSCRTMGGGLFGRDDPVGIWTEKGYRIIVETVRVSNQAAKAIEITPTQRKWRSTPRPPLSLLTFARYFMLRCN